MSNMTINNAGARIWRNGNQVHRVDGPAIIRKNGNQEWWINGVRHRDNGPAIETKDGTNIWYQHGKIHRENGPALTRADGYCEWRINDRLHRSDGPAITWPSGASRWFYEGYHIEKYDIPFVNSDFAINQYTVISLRIQREGGKEWSSCTYSKNNASQQTDVNYYIHRENGPANYWPDGTKMWTVKGIHHRADGPAVECADGTNHWYWNNQYVSEFEHMMLAEQEMANG